MVMKIYGGVPMNIELPEKFFYTSRYRYNSYVQNGKLYVEGGLEYEDLMYSLSYSIHGYDKCVYCGKVLARRNRTLDHMYPRNWGGVSIPDNLVPSCSSCNSQKSNLTYKQFLKWRSLEKSERASYYEKMIKENKRKMDEGTFLPKEWLSLFDISRVIQDIDFKQIEQMGNRKIDTYYAIHGYYPRPIIISSNNWVFKGLHILYHAKNHNIRAVQAVQLDNVIRTSI